MPRVVAETLFVLVAAALFAPQWCLLTTAAVALTLTRPVFPFSYCADLVQKRLHHDVGHLLEAMRAGFNLVSRALRRLCRPSSARGAHVV